MLKTDPDLVAQYKPGPDVFFRRPEHEVWEHFYALCVGTHIANAHVGWWDEPRNYGELIALAHSELSESLEADRKGLKDDHLPEHDGRVVELIDTLIRVCDMLGAMAVSEKVNPAEILRQKIAYNMERADHKRENRTKDGGKAY